MAPAGTGSLLMDGSSTARVLWRMWLLAVVVVAIAMLYLAKVLFLPLAFAILFAFLLAPMVARLERLRLPRAISALVVILAFAGILGCVGWIFFSQLVGIANDLPTYRGNISQKMAALHTPKNSTYDRAERELGRLSDELGLSEAATSPSTPAHPERKPLGTSPDRPVQVKEVSHTPARLDQLGGIVEPLTTALLSVVFTFFVVLQREDLRNRLIRLSGDRNVTVITQAMDDASGRISRYFRLQVLVNAAYGVIICSVLYAIGLPHPLLFATLAAILRFVPYIGWMGAAVLPTVLSLAVFHGWQRSLIIVGTFLCLEIITGNYAEPRIYGKHTGLSSLAILLAAAFWTLLWGPVGLVLSVPLTVCLIVIGRHVPSLEFLTVMLGDRPPIPLWMGFYQRLLAGDEHEATEILDSSLKKMPIEECYDTILIPALLKSEEDRQHNDLEPGTLQFIRHAARDLVEEAGFRENREIELRTFESVVPAADADRPATRVMCIPVRENKDELTALMLAQVLDGGSSEAFVTSAERLDELVAAVIRENPGIVFLSALYPVGMARLHRIYRALRSKSPHTRIMLGIWGFPDDPAEAARKITDGNESRVWTQFTHALIEVRSSTREDTEPAVPQPIPNKSAA